MRKFVTFAFIGVFAVSVASCGSQGSNSASGLEVDSLVGPSALEARSPSGGGGKGGGKGGGGTTSGGSGTLTLRMVNDANGDGYPNWKDVITFTVTTSAGAPFVRLNCYQGSTWVYTGAVGFFDAYPWAKEYYLTSNYWLGGGADCSAYIYTSHDGSSETRVGTPLSFHVNP
jgi:hypothetical protein